MVHYILERSVHTVICLVTVAFVFNLSLDLARRQVFHEEFMEVQ